MVLDGWLLGVGSRAARKATGGRGRHVAAGRVRDGPRWLKDELVRQGAMSVDEGKIAAGAEPG